MILSTRLIKADGSNPIHGWRRDCRGCSGSLDACLEPFRAAGLHSAMYVIPGLEGLLAVVLFAASRTVTRDVEALRAWWASRAIEHIS